MRERRLVKDEAGEMVKILGQLDEALKRAVLYSRKHGFYSCEHILAHMANHLQALQEAFKASKPGFAL